MTVSRPVRLTAGALMLAAAAGMGLRAFAAPGARALTLEYSFQPSLGAAEAWSFGVLWACTAFAALGAWLALSALPTPVRDFPELDARQRGFVLLGMSATAILVATLLRAFVIQGAAFSDDERAYLFVAEALLQGEFTLPTSPRVPIQGFLVLTHDGRMGSIFPIGASALIAAGTLLGNPHLLQAVAAGAIVWFTGVIAAQVQERTGAVSLRAACLMLCSPMLLFHAATLHNIVPATALGLASLSVFLRFLQRPDWRLLLISGGLGGLTAVVRPDAGAVVALALAIGTLAEASLSKAGQLRDVGTRGIALALAFAVGALPLFWSYFQLTGDPFQSPYTLWIEQHQPGTRMFGFGRAPYGWEQTFGSSLSKSLAYSARLSTWWLGSAPWLLLLALVPFVWGGLTRRWASLVAMLLAHQVVLWLYTLWSVHDFGSAYHVFSAPVLCVLAAVGWQRMGERFSSAGRVAVAHGLAIALVFWPFAILRTVDTADRIKAPIELAENAAEAGHVAVLWNYMHGGLISSWVFYPPAHPYPDDQPVLWLPASMGKPGDLGSLVGDRRLFVLRHSADRLPVLVASSVE